MCRPSRMGENALTAGPTTPAAAHTFLPFIARCAPDFPSVRETRPPSFKNDISCESYRFLCDHGTGGQDSWRNCEIIPHHKLVCMRNFQYFPFMHPPHSSYVCYTFIISLKNVLQMGIPPSSLVGALPIGLFVIQATAADNGRERKESRAC